MLVLVCVSVLGTPCSWETIESPSNVLSASIWSEILRRLSLKIQIQVRRADSDKSVWLKDNQFLKSGRGDRWSLAQALEH
jgi:hypothetical protein